MLVARTGMECRGGDMAEADGRSSSVFDGIFSINKSVGMTSHDVVARVRRLAHQKRVGHAGTLDPAADGVLPICLGQATRIVEYLSESGKAYRATVRFGVVTDTYDREGRIVREAPVTLTLDKIAERLFLSGHTVKAQRRAIYRKLGVSTRNDAVQAATTLGLLGG